MGTVGGNKVGGLLGRDHVDLGIMGLNEGPAVRVGLADHHQAGLLQQDALQGAKAGGTGAQQQDGVPGVDLPDIRGPVARGQDISHKEGLLIGDLLGDEVQALIGVGDPDILRLTAVDAAAQGPAAVGVGAVVDPAVLAEEAVAAEGFHVDGDPVPRAHRGDLVANLFHNAHHLVARGDAGHGPGDAAVFDVEITGADAGQGDPDDGVPGVQQAGLGFVQQGKGAWGGIGIGQHRATS